MPMEEGGEISVELDFKRRRITIPPFLSFLSPSFATKDISMGRGTHSSTSSLGHPESHEEKGEEGQLATESVPPPFSSNSTLPLPPFSSPSLRPSLETNSLWRVDRLDRIELGRTWLGCYVSLRGCWRWRGGREERRGRSSLSALSLPFFSRGRRESELRTGRKIFSRTL